MAVLSIAPFLNIANRLPGFDGRRGTSLTFKVDRFKSWFGANPVAHAHQLFNDLKTTTMPGASIKPDADPKYLLMALDFLNTYKSEAVLAGTFGVHKQTGRKWVWFYVQKIGALKGLKVSLLLLPVCKMT